MNSSINIESKLINAVKRGDLQAYDQLMEMYLPQIRAFIALRVPVSDIIDELTQETFIFAYRRIDSFTTGTQFRAWLFAITRNMLRKKIQQYARESVNKERYLLFSSLIDKADDSDNGDEIAALQTCLGSIPENQSKLIKLKYLEKLKGEQIAEALNRSTDWVYQNLHRIRSAMRTCIKERLSRQGDSI